MMLINGYFKIMLIGFFVMSFFVPSFAQEYPYTTSTEKGTIYIGILPEFSEPNSDVVKINIDFINPTTKKIQEHIDYSMSLIKDNESVFGPTAITHTTSGSVSIPVEIPEEGKYTLQLEVEGILFQPIPKESASIELELDKTAKELTTTAGTKEGEENLNSQGCLIATASYSSEMAPQVQMLREIRDNQLLQTESGSAFMKSFNTFYYSFAPTVAGWEHENPAFKEIVKITITPLVASLSLLNYVSMDSEAEVLGYGISMIALNLGMYIAVPALVGFKVHKHLKSNNT